jgi:hypothetical protein
MGDVTPKLRDERLAWLAVRDELRRRGTNNPFKALIRVTAAARPQAKMRRDGTAVAGLRGNEDIDIVKGRMMRYAYAVDDVAKRLSAEERQVLRATGEVPGWFLPEVHRRYRELRRRWQ